MSPDRLIVIFAKLSSSPPGVNIICAAAARFSSAVAPSGRFQLFLDTEYQHVNLSLELIYFPRNLTRFF